MSEQQFQAEVMDELRQKEEQMNTFEKLSKINVRDYVEKKGKFNYLSWTYAISELRKAVPSATWEVIKTDGLPFCKTECGYFVEVAVTVDGITLSQIHPVLDNNNKTIPAPNAFQINTSIQRCLVKAIALHGLGLSIYSGEDLPEEETKVAPVVRPTLVQAPKLESLEYYKGQIGKTQSLSELQKAYSEIYPVIKNHPAILVEVDKVKEDLKSLFNDAAKV